MKRGLLSYGVGPHAEYLEIAKPSYQAFAAKHGYDLLLPEPIPNDRHPSWWKIPLLKEALQEYDEILFLGADLVIVDGSEDVPFPEGYWQALVSHKTGQGEIPNADMWFLRKPMLDYMDPIWGMTQYLNHGWWEQRALIDLMGYACDPYFQPAEPAMLYEKTFFLDSAWNVHVHDENRSAFPRIQHATMWPDRAAIMREWAAVAT